MSQIGSLRHLPCMVNVLVTGSSESEASARVEGLFAANERRLGQFLVQMVRDRALAEDLLQETFMDAYDARDRLASVVSPDAWLFGIARHRALEALRRSRRMHRAVERPGNVGSLRRRSRVVWS